VNWSEFLNHLFLEFRYNTSKFEKDFGISNVALGKILKGVTQKPNVLTISKIEKAFNIKIDDRDPNNITYTTLSKSPVPNTGVEFENQMQTFEYPVLSEVYAGDPKRIEVEYNDFYEPFTYKRKDHKCFALMVNGDSMETTLRHGDIVLVDMDLLPLDGDLVVVKLKNGNQYIKRFKDLNYAFIQLSSDNPDYGVRLIDKNDITAIYPVVSINLNLRNGERKK